MKAISAVVTAASAVVSAVVGEDFAYRVIPYEQTKQRLRPHGGQGDTSIESRTARVHRYEIVTTGDMGTKSILVLKHIIYQEGEASKHCLYATVTNENCAFNPILPEGFNCRNSRHPDLDRIFAGVFDRDDLPEMFSVVSRGMGGLGDIWSERTVDGQSVRDDLPDFAVTMAHLRTLLQFVPTTQKIRTRLQQHINDHACTEMFDTLVYHCTPETFIKQRKYEDSIERLTAVKPAPASVCEVKRPGLDIPSGEVKRPDVPSAEMKRPDIPSAEVKRPDIPSAEVERWTPDFVSSLPDYKPDLVSALPDYASIIKALPTMTFADLSKMSESQVTMMHKVIREALWTSSHQPWTLFEMYGPCGLAFVPANILINAAHELANNGRVVNKNQKSVAEYRDSHRGLNGYDYFDALIVNLSDYIDKAATDKWDTNVLSGIVKARWATILERTPGLPAPLDVPAPVRIVRQDGRRPTPGDIAKFSAARAFTESLGKGGDLIIKSDNQDMCVLIPTTEPSEPRPGWYTGLLKHESADITVTIK
jgi:hypothetical protein